MFTKLREKKAFTLVEIMIVVAIIGLLAAIAVPNFLKARTETRKNACINNLRLIEAAKDQSALDNNIADGSAATNMNDYLRGGTAKVICPSDPGKTYATSYTENNIGTTAVCKIVPGTHKI